MLTPRQVRAAMAAVLMTTLLAALDQTVVSVAVPTIARQVGGLDWMAWVISGYLIASTVVTPLYGRFSDLHGRQRLMTIAILIFLLASAGCALAQTMPQLVVARVLQGIGGGGLLAMAQTVVADVIAPRERGRWQGYIAVVWALASVLGPVIGGVLTQYLSWPWIFWINLPVGLVALVLARTALGALRVPGQRARIDAGGAVLLLAGLTTFLLPVTRVGQGVPWNDGANLAAWALAAVLLAGFVAVERRHVDPVVPLGLFAQPVVSAGCALFFVCFFNFIALTVLVPLRLQMAGGLDAADAAMRLLPLTLAIPTAAFVAGRWQYRTGRVLPAQRLGVLLVPPGLAAYALLPPEHLLAALALVATGFGMGLQMPTTLITVQLSVARPVMGTVTALTAFFRLLGGALGIAVYNSMVLFLLREHLPESTAVAGDALASVLAHGTSATRLASDAAFRTVTLVAAAFALLSVWWVTRLPDVDASGRTAPALDGQAPR